MQIGKWEKENLPNEAIKEQLKKMLTKYRGKLHQTFTLFCNLKSHWKNINTISMITNFYTAGWQPSELQFKSLWEPFLMLIFFWPVGLYYSCYSVTVIQIIDILELVCFWLCTMIQTGLRLSSLLVGSIPLQCSMMVDHFHWRCEISHGSPNSSPQTGW
jgi:hypothetical protein